MHARQRTNCTSTGQLCWRASWRACCTCSTLTGLALEVLLATFSLYYVTIIPIIPSSQPWTKQVISTRLKNRKHTRVTWLSERPTRKHKLASPSDVLSLPADRASTPWLAAAWKYACTILHG
jgi:hypothetical protein